MTGLIHWYLLPDGGTIRTKRYCETLGPPQSGPATSTSPQSHSEPHVAKVTERKLTVLGWE
ncbi:hypothetical protein KIN20_001263 [Parelaphostrongylus tenuis]|uniref:Uncharacterized protein n=1 Tax=Parelaphostrongylus tenuis TaxID=148309 RepID=A0AAD5LXV0_PARTN|nr:hypothetical protein KIN20_001263 [Parelaphostrongylus tenuis]